MPALSYPRENRGAYDQRPRGELAPTRARLACQQRLQLTVLAGSSNGLKHAPATAYRGLDVHDVHDLHSSSPPPALFPPSGTRQGRSEATARWHSRRVRTTPLEPCQFQLCKFSLRLAPSLSDDPSPSRITRKNYWPRVPNRTMVVSRSEFGRIQREIVQGGEKIVITSCVHKSVFLTMAALFFLLACRLNEARSCHFLRNASKRFLVFLFLRFLFVSHEVRHATASC